MIETDRLLLRPIKLNDLDRWAELSQMEHATRYIGGIQGRPTVWRSMMCMIGAWHETGVAMFSVIEKSSGQWIGRIGPWHPEGWPGDEVGWSLHPDAWGKGYATEASVLAMDYAVNVLGWTDIIHSIDPDNHPSKSVAARLGSTLIRTGKFLPEPFEESVVEIWGQSAADWKVARVNDERIAEILARAIQTG